MSDLTADVRLILEAYLSRNEVPADELPRVISDVFAAWKQCVTPCPRSGEETVSPRINVEETIRERSLVCLEDGREVTLLKPHLQRNHNMTPSEYIAKWGLPEDYPMVAPGYSEWRSQVAKKNGLGKTVSG